MKVLRWILMPLACIAAWFVALYVGFYIYSYAMSVCPKAGDFGVGFDPEVPRPRWWPLVEYSIFCFGAGLSAILVVTAGFFVAPAARAVVAWLVFVGGSVVAIWMASGEGDVFWAMCFSAIVAGLIATLLLSRSRFAKPPNNAAEPTANRSAGGDSSP